MKNSKTDREDGCKTAQAARSLRNELACIQGYAQALGRNGLDAPMRVEFAFQMAALAKRAQASASVLLEAVPDAGHSDQNEPVEIVLGRPLLEGRAGSGPIPRPRGCFRIVAAAVVLLTPAVGILFQSYLAQGFPARGLPAGGAGIPGLSQGRDPVESQVSAASPGELPGRSALNLVSLANQGRVLRPWGSRVQGDPVTDIGSSGARRPAFDARPSPPAREAVRSGK